MEQSLKKKDTFDIMNDVIRFEEETEKCFNIAQHDI